MIAETKPLADITHEAIQVLCKEIGIANTMRFVGQFTAGYGNYTDDREKLFEGMTLDSIVSEIRQEKTGQP